MKYGSLILEKKEYVYLKRILNISGYAEDHETQRCLMALSEELKSAHIVDEEDIPDDVIRFNSNVTLVLESGIEKQLRVVAPMYKDLKQNKISILTPMGSALIGYSTNDEIFWDFPSGKQQLKIVNVVQEKSMDKIDVLI
ncbi:GreA/GreB family elongation factor [Winogradskyella bathintestinalis]|uniref:GreA/GreB family elongation factor n=1 Tax=Winogradskyella bathintestinalis TaxID=3035208 RepID=A0ABT7ZV34_9FLAO|nr:GreA/GreB family elongation factor [Winogradskyella bathintestinalis]MDN3492832.1 GreA/GreB family elongation factor [Winogradskyella bathintestinalis]